MSSTAVNAATGPPTLDDSVSGLQRVARVSTWWSMSTGNTQHQRLRMPACVRMSTCAPQAARHRRVGVVGPPLAFAGLENELASLRERNVQQVAQARAERVARGIAQRDGRQPDCVVG